MGQAVDGPRAARENSATGTHATKYNFARVKTSL